MTDSQDPLVTQESDPGNARGWTGYVVNQLAAQIRDATAAQLRPLDLTPPMVRVLGQLASMDATTQVALADSTGIDRTSMSQIIDHFEALNYARRTRHPSDRRAHAVVLTEAGQKALDEATSSARAAEQAFLAPLDTSEQAELKRLLLKLHTTHSPCKEIFK